LRKKKKCKENPKQKMWWEREGTSSWGKGGEKQDIFYDDDSKLAQKKGCEKKKGGITSFSSDNYGRGGGPSGRTKYSQCRREESRGTYHNGAVCERGSKDDILGELTTKMVLFQGGKSGRDGCEKATNHR